MRLKRSLILLCVLSIGSLLGSGWASEQDLTLEGAVSLALQNNPEVRLAMKGVEASEARFLQAEALPNPEILLATEAIPWSLRGGGTEVTLGISQTLEFPGKRRLRKDIFRKSEEIARADLERVRMVVTARVKKAYFRAAHSQAIITRLESLLDVLAEYREMADIRFRAGEVTATDVFRGRLEVIKVQNDIIDARRAGSADLVDLEILLGTELDPSTRLATELAFIPLIGSLEDLEKQAENRPSLFALNLERERAEAAIEFARKSLYPDFSLGLMAPSKSFSAWGFEVGAALPLFRKRQTGEMREATALHEERLIALEAKKRQVRMRLRSAYSDVKAAEERLEIFKKSLLGEAEDMLLAVINDYRFGKTGSLAVFDVYRIYKETLLEHLNTLLDYRLSLAELEAAGEED